MEDFPEPETPVKTINSLVSKSEVYRFQIVDFDFLKMIWRLFTLF